MATLDDAARSLGMTALGLFEEERERTRGMTPMDRFLAEKKTSTLAKPVVEEKTKDHDQDLISLDTDGMILGADIDEDMTRGSWLGWKRGNGKTFVAAQPNHPKEMYGSNDIEAYMISRKR